MNTYLFNPHTSPLYLVFLRISTGIILLVSMFNLLPDFSNIYGVKGIVDPELLALKKSYSLPSIHTLVETIQSYTGLEQDFILTGILVFYLILCILLVLGLFTKPAALLLLLLHGSIFTSLPQFSYGFDYFCTIALFYCLIFPTHRYTSLDKILFNLKPSTWVSFCLRILQIHICLVYFFGGLGKIVGHTWRNGEALWKTVHLPYFDNALNFDALGNYPWLWIIGGWAICLIEILHPVFIHLKKTRTTMLSLIILLHLSIALILNLYLFSAIMIAFNITAYYYPFLDTNNEIQTANHTITSSPIETM